MLVDVDMVDCAAALLARVAVGQVGYALSLGWSETPSATMA